MTTACVKEMPCNTKGLVAKFRFSGLLCTATKPPSDEGGGFAVRQRRRERNKNSLKLLKIERKHRFFSPSVGIADSPLGMMGVRKTVKPKI